MFNIENYKREKEQVIKEIKKSLPDWEHTQGFVADGLLSPEEYARQTFKVLFILGEYYDNDKNGMIDIETQPETDFWRIKEPGYKTAKAVPFLLWYIYKYHGVEAREIKREFFKTSPKNAAELQKYFKRAGVIDIKKESASMADNRQTDEKIFDAAKKNRDILIHQIESMSPDLIIMCSNAVKDSVIKEKILVFPDYPDKKPIPKDKIIHDDKNRYIIFTKHPRWWSYADVHSIYQIIAPYIKS
ncbi:hypothetical protein AGMMS50293_04050 [Spirochaetia bacterium]|nr:hypothetical protein AGMMS50293_04050 [Spirochaetia bacterium]